MKISDILKERFTYSFEVFPPKADKPVEPLLSTLEHLYAFAPDFISCTYGAGGTNKGRNEEVCRAIQARGKAQALSHFTCVGNTKEDIDGGVAVYKALGIENLLALRGDLPAGWDKTRGQFAHADQLIGYLMQSAPAFCIGGACYPEKHLQASSQEADIAALKQKQDSGASFLTTQLCYDLNALEGFIDRIRSAGITLPVIAGIMPVLSKDGLIRMTLSNGCSIPAALSALIGRYGESTEDFRKAGKDYTVALLRDAQRLPVNGLHIYTLNRYEDVTDILRMASLRQHSNPQHP